jgi:hypothetical protein
MARFAACFGSQLRCLCRFGRDRVQARMRAVARKHREFVQQSLAVPDAARVVASRCVHKLYMLVVESSASRVSAFALWAVRKRPTQLRAAVQTALPYSAQLSCSRHLVYAAARVSRARLRADATPRLLQQWC